MITHINMVSQVQIFNSPDMFAMKTKVKKVCDLYDFNTTGHTNNMIRHMGGRIYMKCIQNITILFNDINISRYLNLTSGIKQQNL